MAVNIVSLLPNLSPTASYLEEFVSVDENIKFQIESGSGYPGQGGCYYGVGKLYLTNLRIIFIPDVPSYTFNSFSLPFMLIKKYNSEYPWFDDARITGTISPITHGGLNGDGNFTLIFPSKSLVESFSKLSEPPWKRALHILGVGSEEDQRPYNIISNFPSNNNNVVAMQISSPLPHISDNEAYIDPTHSNTILLTR